MSFLPAGGPQSIYQAIHAADSSPERQDRQRLLPFDAVLSDMEDGANVNLSLKRPSEQALQMSLTACQGPASNAPA